MSLEDFKRIIANLRSCFDVRIVSLHRDGEPLLNKRLEAYISHLRDLGIYVTMSSNCSLISEERAESLVEAGLRMVGTDFCAEPALYEKLRARGVWSETLAGIRSLLSAAVAARSDLRFVIKDMATHGRSVADGKALMEQTRALFADWADRVTVMPVYFHNALGESLVNLNAPGATSNGANAVYTLCHQPWVNFTVDFAGRVVGCCRDLRSEYALGSLLEQSADAIWNGERMVQLRRALVGKRPEDISICKACDVPRNGERMVQLRRALVDKRPEDIAICKACDVPRHGSYSGRTPLEKVRNFFFSGAWRR
jgi:radical SAM protein with 4Fe4S-binding SPASM domain